MNRHENTGEGTGDYLPGERRDHRRARREWQCQQYRDAETDLAGDEEATPLRRRSDPPWTVQPGQCSRPPEPVTVIILP